ncbi:hypothetical protein [Streptomyces sp. NPDC048172]|uniref:hypothetical protein n=1 Tax=Streptomyces sp. NPDC048172 TaxID=3365505 RepID=UPI0037123244
MPRLTPLKTPLKATGVLVGALTVAALAAGPASAAQGKVDGTIAAGDRSCSWTDGVTSDTAPNALTVDRSSINGKLSCSGLSATLNNDPAVTFDDAAGTAKADVLDVSVTVIGVTCRYKAEGLSAKRDGDTRNYSATADAKLTEGGALCPATQSVTATLKFH